MAFLKNFLGLGCNWQTHRCAYTQLATLGVLLLLMLVVLSSCSKPTPGVLPAYRALNEAVYASGSLRPADEYRVLPLATGKVTALLVEAGDNVKAGQVLAQLTSDQPEIQLKDAQDRLQSLHDRLRPNSPQLMEAQQAIELARLQLAQDSVDWQKYVRLAEQNATARRQLELAETRYRSSRINLELATKRLASLRDQLETERNAASRQVQLLSSRASDYVITAAIAGKVYSRNVELGELVSPQTPLFIIGSADRFLLKLLVDEEDINLIAPGQKCLIRLENYTDSLFEGKVVRILPQIQPESNSFLVEAVLNQAPAKLYNGLSVEANIITRQKDRALVIPAAYLQAGDSVWVANGKQHEKRPVVVGLRTLDWVEITQGLDTETEVFLPKQ